MPRAAQDKSYRTFIQGFLTEATGLTFPENSARDIDNCDIELKGSVRRRLGLNEEPNGYLLGTGTVAAQTGSVLAGPFSRLPTASEVCPKEAVVVTVHPWPNPGGNTNLNFLVIQVGNSVIVRDWDAETVTDPSLIFEHVTGATQFDLDHAVTGLVYNTSHIESAKTPMQSAVGFGRIWLTSSALLPFYIEYDSALKTLDVRPVGYNAADATTANGRLSIRDFNGVADGLATETQPLTLSNTHKYNLFNQGWGNSQINAYFSSQSKYPSNAQQWILGKDASGNFDASLLAKQDFGNSPAPKGRAILNALLGDRDTAFAGLNLLDQHDEKASSSFATCAFFAGRVWLSGDVNPKRPNGVYFSKTLNKIQDAGLLMQENDPTSEHFPDVLATDGGVIYITEAANIQKLVPFGAGLLVCASNGIWFIYGGEGGFTASNFSVEKVSSTGILSASSVTQTDQQVVFFAENSIHVIALPESGIIPAIQDIGQTKIFSYYGTIPREARVRAQACFDIISKKVFWSWLDLGDVDNYSYPRFQSAYNRMLIMDTRTGAYTKYSFTGDQAQFYFNGPAFPKRSISRPQALQNVVVNVAGQVTHSTQGEVIVFEDADVTNEFINSVKVLFIDGPLASLRISEFYDTNFRDYRTMTYGVKDYTSFLVTGEELVDDLMRNKQATYLHSFFQRTENGVELDVNSVLVFKNPSGCTLVARWDWHNTIGGGRWSASQMAYRYRRPYQPVDINDPVDTGEEIVYTKLKIRGKGRALALRYDSVSQKDFQLLGYAVAFTANGT